MGLLRGVGGKSDAGDSVKEASESPFVCVEPRKRPAVSVFTPSWWPLQAGVGGGDGAPFDW